MGEIMNRLWIGIVGLVIAIAPLCSQAQCTKPLEWTAFQVRQLQTELMVGALRCGLRDDYNGFAVKFQPVLVKNGKVMAGYFQRVYGGEGISRQDRFVTSLANDISKMSGEGQPFTCARVRKIMGQLNRVSDDRDFENFVKILDRPGNFLPQSCPVQAVAGVIPNGIKEQ